MTSIRAGAFRSPPSWWPPLPPPRSAAQTPRPMGIVDLLNVPRLADPQLSPDGRDVLYHAERRRLEGGKRITHIWRARVDGGEPVQLTTGAEGETTPRWSPDGKTIAFVAKRGGDEFAQIYLLPIDGGEARPLTTHATAVSDIGLVARRRGALLHGGRRQDRRREGAREGARRRLRASTRTSSRRTCGRSTSPTDAETRVTDGRLLGHRLRAVARRRADRATTARRRRCSATATRARCG